MKGKIALLVVLILLLGVLVTFALFGDTIMAILNPIRNDWYVDKDTGETYFLDGDSEPLSGWFELNGARYYLNPANGGAMYTGWLELDGETYYLGTDGAMVIGWVKLDGQDYYLDEDGKLYSGWLESDGKRYYLNEEGTPLSGWQDIEGTRYYLNEDGSIASGWLELDGQKYYLNDDGSIYTGKLETDEGTYILDETGAVSTGWVEVGGASFYLGEDGLPMSGWVHTDAGKFYLNEDGSIHTGWLETDEGKYYLNEDGSYYTGWLELDGQKYYLKEDGTAAKGKLVIDEKTYYFTSTGANIILVNRWNEVPEDYEVELKALDNGKKVAVECYDALVQMVADCEAAGCDPEVIGGYRTLGDQRSLFNNKIAAYQEKGYSYSAAYSATMEGVAIPGTSEHHLGLAVDILDEKYPRKYTGDDNSIVWMAEHCWEYGFIVRYAEDKKNITGIKFEPWHYRYVGVELAMELKDSGLSLEEYLDQLTNDGTTCGNPDALN